MDIFFLWLLREEYLVSFKTLKNKGIFHIYGILGRHRFVIWYDLANLLLNCHVDICELCQTNVKLELSLVSCVNFNVASFVMFCMMVTSPSLVILVLYNLKKIINLNLSRGIGNYSL